MSNIVAQFTGELGGLIAVAFGTGCGSGYGFAIRTAYKAVKDRLDKVEAAAREEQGRCEAKISSLVQRQRELEDMLLGRRKLGFFSPVEGSLEPEKGKSS